MRPPFCIAASGLSSSRFDTAADARMSSSPSFAMSLTLSVNAWLCESSVVTASR